MGFSLFILILLLALGSIVYYSWQYGISPTPSTEKARQAIIDLIPASMRGIIYELGSGWGTLALPLAAHFPNATIKAYEMSLIPWMVSKGHALWAGHPNLEIYRKDFFKVPLEDAQVVVCYLYPGAMKKLKQKFEKELKPGTLIVSNTFGIAGWSPLKVIELNDLYRSRVYLYKMKG